MKDIAICVLVLIILIIGISGVVGLFSLTGLTLKRFLCFVASIILIGSAASWWIDFLKLLFKIR